MIDVERLKHDRDYWDCIAPDGAEWFGITANEEQVCWYRDGERGKDFSYNTVCAVPWMPVSGQPIWQPLIPRPTRKQWSGPEGVRV